MNCYRICGGRPLQGEVQISGTKNTALAILFATILVKSPCVIENVPKISDIQTTIQLLQSLGATVFWQDETSLYVDTTQLIDTIPQHHLVCRMRASSYLLGTMLGRFGSCNMSYPGGCNFGVRPLDQHMYAFSALGAKISNDHEEISITADSLHANNIYFQTISVGATINAIFAAVCAEGVTHIYDGAKEPHVCDTVDFLNRCGADIRRVGTNHIIVFGKKDLYGCTYRVGPDMIEAGTYLIAALATGGSASCIDVEPKQLESLTTTLERMGNKFIISANQILGMRGNYLHGVDVTTAPYPGFPTDLHPQLAVLQALAQKKGSIREAVWGQRFQYLDELKKMGVCVQIDHDCATFFPSCLKSAEVTAPDLRGGAALLIASLGANGESKIYNPEPIERGYMNIIGKLRSLGADIEKIEV